MNVSCVWFHDSQDFDICPGICSEQDVARAFAQTNVSEAYEACLLLLCVCVCVLLRVAAHAPVRLPPVRPAPHFSRKTLSRPPWCSLTSTFLCCGSGVALCREDDDVNTLDREEYQELLARLAVYHYPG